MKLNLGFLKSKKNSTRGGYQPGKRAPRHHYYSSSPVLHVQIPKWRARLLFVVISLGFTTVIAKSLYLQTMNNDFLQAEGGKRYERTLVLPANRGRVLDRNGEFLATSIPARAVWASPEETRSATPQELARLAQLIDMPLKDLHTRLSSSDKTFVYLRRQLAMEPAAEIQKMKIPGIGLLSETRRSYPQGSLMAHIVGFTNIEDRGIEGVEMEFNKQLSGQPGLRKVLRDRLGRIIGDTQEVEPARDGQNLELTIDSRVQFLVSKALQKAITDHEASSGAAVVVDAQNGEILSMVSLPTYDPNNPQERRGAALRNRAITDTFEPGSIVKPLVAALALDAGAVTTKTKFNTGHGTYRYQGATITDVSTRNGVLDVAGIIRRSSNIGMTMISERLRSEQMWTVFNALGFGQAPNMGFPGAASGRVRPWERWRPIERATMAYGYGLSVSLLQMAHAYTSLARNGDMISLSLVKNRANPTSIQIYKPETARAVREMLEDAAGSEGTKIQGKVMGYRIGGKSGTARKIINGHYSRKDYRGSFVAMAPISKPRIIVAVTLDQPRKGGYYGSVISGPVAASIIEDTLKYLAVPPDAPIEPAPLEARNTVPKRSQG